MTPFRPAAVVFDMDGLLFDTEPLYRDTLVALGRSLGFAQFDMAFARLTTGMSWAATRALVHDQLGGAHDPDDFIAEWMAAFHRAADERLALKPGVLELLDTLDRAGVRKAVATNSSRETVGRHLQRSGLARRFAEVVAAEDCAAGKPAPDPYLEAARRLRVRPEDCLALEDSINGVVSASRAGMVTVMVPDLVPPDKPTAALCTMVVASLLDVRGIIAA